MLLTPRSYNLAQTSPSLNANASTADGAFFVCTTPHKQLAAEASRARTMLLLHQTGAVKVGEVVRYTLTYTPSDDRILPAPAHLHVRIRNTAALPLRAAYLHGPYTVHVAAYPDSFNPNRKQDSNKTYGVPDFEPNLKAGGAWSARLTVPEHTRQGDEWRNMDGSPKSATWIIEVASQIIFSNSASVSYELLVARDERSLDLGFTAVTGNSHGAPGRVQDHQQQHDRHPAQQKGVYSKAVRLVVDDTASLWNKPALPDHVDDANEHAPPADNRRQKKVHLVVVTHGMHSNLGADMLYLKESIDATARQAREDRRRRRREQRAAAPPASDSRNDTSTAPLSGGQEGMSSTAEHDDDDYDSDEEDVIVRGFDGNVMRTERGIQYLGKRLAKHVLRLTYPDQPFLPVTKSVGQKLNPFSPAKTKTDDGIPSHDGSSVHRPHFKKPRRAYKFTSISFIGHSLGGPVQTYAIAYIYKHSPQFFHLIKPVNFIALASPFLGLSNENPMYVKFALDFGLVGRTGQDLGLTWRAPTLAKSGWTAMVSGFGAQSQHQQEDDPGAKPLLRILPTGPAHLALRMFRNRTVYSNVVNDGIVPLRTSCLLFLDWRGLGKVEKARRENGLIGSVAVWGFGQLTGQNSSPNPSRIGFTEDENEVSESPSGHGDGTAVPLPAEDVTNQDDAVAASDPATQQYLSAPQSKSAGGSPAEQPPSDQYFQPQNTLMQLWSYIRPTGRHTTKDKKMFTRSQTIYKDDEEQEEAPAEVPAPADQPRSRKRPQATRGHSMSGDSQSSSAPPKTTIFESAGDLINPPVPPTSWITDPSTRARTIFHDRVYHPEDIPPPPTKKRTASRSSSGDSTSSATVATTDDSVMRVEEKIARAYHKDLSWRKVLVRLEPDAHNNIIVRRMFANAYGWPVVKHLCDTHFADTYSAQTRDEDEPAIDRAKGIDVPVREDGEHVRGQENTQPPIERTESELREVRDELAPLNTSIKGPRRVNTVDSIRSSTSADWDSIYFEGTSDEEDEKDDRNAIQKFWQPNGARSPRSPMSPTSAKSPGGHGTSDAEITDFLHGPPRLDPATLNVHRGLGPSPIKSPRSPRSMKSVRSTSSSKSAEPDSIQSFGGQAPVLGEEQPLVASPPVSPSIANISEVGLRRSLDGSPEANRARSSSGVGEQVARMSSVKDNERSS